MPNLLRQKLSALHNSIVGAHESSKNYPSPVTGREREVFVTNFLYEVLPNSFRIGAGVICDAIGNSTGQIDIVIELPMSVSFPIIGENRLYPADTIGAAIEVKSDLGRQWEEMLSKVRDIRSVSTNFPPLDPEDMRPYDHAKVPTFIVGYKGPASIESLYNRIGNLREFPMPSGIFIIESGVYLGYIDGQWTEASSAELSTFAFISELFDALHKRSNNRIKFENYRSILTKQDDN